MQFTSKSGFVIFSIRFTLELGKSKSGKTFFIRLGVGRNQSPKLIGRL